MKRFFTYISILTLAVACNDIYGPEEIPVAPDTPAGVEITFSEVKDSSFVVTVTPKDEASFYSYLVDMADAPEVLDAESLYKVKYSSIAQGTVKWSEDKPSFTFIVDEVIQDATYQVYAVAGSPMGIIGEVCTASVSTSDTHAPNIEDYATGEDADGVNPYVVLLFDEEVKPVGDVTVRYFKRWTAENDIYNDIEAGTVTVPASAIDAADGLMPEFMVEGVPAGAYYTVSWAEGAFEDAAGNKIAAMESGFYTTEEGSLAPYGLYGRAPFVSFDVTPIEAESFAEYTDPFVTGFETENAVMKGSAVEGAVATAVYVLGSKTVSLELEYGKDYAFYQGYCLVYLPEEPDRGAVATVTIPAGTFVDEWGNSSNEFTHSAVYSYGYSLDNIIGDWEFTGESAFDGSAVPGTMTIAASDDEESGNVMITSFMGIPCMAPVYATFDIHAGSLSVYGYQAFYQEVDDADTPDDASDDATYTYFFYTNANEYLNLKMPQADVLASPDDIFGVVYAVNGSLTDWIYAFADFEGAKVPAAESAAVTSLSSIVKGSFHKIENPRF